MGEPNRRVSDGQVAEGARIYGHRVVANEPTELWHRLCADLQAERDYSARLANAALEEAALKPDSGA